MLNTIWRARWYLLLGLLTFLITLIITVPLHFVWRFVEPQLQGLPVHISQVRGTVWQGNMRVALPALPELGDIEGKWQLQPVGLLAGKLQLSLNLETSDLRLQLPLSFTAKQVVVDGAQGYLDFTPLKPIFMRERGNAEGAVELRNLQAKISLEPLLIQELAGQMTYTGGAVSLLVDGRPVNAEMPPLIGVLSKEQDQAQLQTSTAEDVSLFSAFVKDNGWAGLAIKRSFIDVLGQTWPIKADADDVIFEVSRKVL